MGARVDDLGSGVDGRPRRGGACPVGDGRFFPLMVSESRPSKILSSAGNGCRDRRPAAAVRARPGNSIPSLSRVSCTGRDRCNNKRLGFYCNECHFYGRSCANATSGRRRFRYRLLRPLSLGTGSPPNGWNSSLRICQITRIGNCFHDLHPDRMPH